jgi:hypothetical protein
MADKKITELSELSSVATDDILVVVDVSDTTQSGAGSTKKITAENVVPDATTTREGKVELATDAETVTGSDTVRAVTPANLVAKMAAPGAIGGTTPSTGAFTTLSTTTTMDVGTVLSVGTTLELDHATDTTLSRAGAGDLAVEGVSVLTTSNTKTVTNKRVNPRTSSSASGDITPDLSSANIYQRTAQSAAITINAPTGTPVLGEVVVLMIKDNGTSRAITWNATYKPMAAALPTATTISKRLLVTAQYDGTDWLTLTAQEE